MPERFVCTFVQKRRYINTLPFLSFQAVANFGNISMAFNWYHDHPLTCTENFMEIVPGEPLRWES